MAHAALISLKQTTYRLLISSHISIAPDPYPQISQVYEDLCSLQDVIEHLDFSRTSLNRNRVNAVDEQIRQALCEFEDMLESHVLNQLISQSEDIHPWILFSVDLQQINQDFDCFLQTLNKLKAAYRKQLRGEECNEEEEEDHFVPSRIDHFVENRDYSKMVGLSDQFMEIKELMLTGSSRFQKKEISLVGMAGIGKTTLVKKLFQDPLILSHYETRVFVAIGPRYELENVLLDILKQVDPRIDDENIAMLMEEGELGLSRMVYGSLTDRKYLIVLDDIWNKELILFDSFPDNNNGSQVLMTSRQLRAGETLSIEVDYKIRLLNNKESWQLLREKVFGEDPLLCPLQLEKAGKKIAEHCEGLPLTIVTVADILSKADKTSEYWNEVAVDNKHSVFVDAYDQISEVLYPSYEYLPQYLKAFFLYVGVFPQNHEVTCSKLTNLFVAEGVVELDPYYRLDEDYFGELVTNNVFMVRKRTYYGGTKIGSLHSSFWYLCNKEARRIKFYHGLNILDDGLAERIIQNQRRLCVRNSVLFAIKDVYDSMASVSTVRSVLCTGPYHKYPVPICLDFMLLRILNALAIRFYEFPVEVMKLVQLRYLALTYDGKFPASIAILWNLQVLIVRRHLSVLKSSGNSSYLPIEIWDMEELQHLRTMGSDLPDPYDEEFLLPNLLTLLDVSPHSCTKRILERIPHLKKLGIRIELSPDHVEPPLYCFDEISCLDELQVLKCVVVNPRILFGVAPPVRLSILPSNLVKLTLSGLGYPWEEMTKISSLPNLRVLKLRCYAFRGPKWEVGVDEFPSLEILLIEDIGLLRWTLIEDCKCFNKLKWIGLKQCYKLQEMPTKFGRCLEKIELVDCNPLVVRWAKQLQEDPHRMYYKSGQFFPLELCVHSSWDI